MNQCTVVRSLILSAILGLIVGACAMKAPMEAIDFERIRADLEKKAQIVSRFRVDFSRTKGSSIFNKPVTAQGRLIINKPDRFRLVMTGDVALEVVSDGQIFAIIHDGKDTEIHTLHGDRDRALFSDPLIALLEGFADGSLKQVKQTATADERNMAAIEILPRNSSRNDHKHQVLVWFDSGGNVERARFLSGTGETDELQIQSWSVLPATDPEITELERRVQQIKTANSTVPGTRNGNAGAAAARTSDN